MKISHMLEATLYDDAGLLSGAESFQKHYAANASGPATFIFPDEVALAEAHLLLQRLNLRGQRFYIFAFEEGELANHPAFYFGVHSVYDLIDGGVISVEKLEGRELAMDYHSEKIVASSRVRRLLSRSATAIRWTDIEGPGPEDWAALEVTQILPDPIFIPSPTEFGESAISNTYWIRSDGRDVISPANAAMVSRTGIAISDSGRTPLGTFSWNARLIVSGEVMDLLVKAKVHGLIAPPSPLLSETAAKMSGESFTRQREG